eukprot:TRINITY_DN47344_c0_g1_i1.p1 TRINITY_DN47344_c0_g1~~TRINITY_DN47344_c0_g1_i1.p1  ORF type:complete len:975 (-),score=184.23 TRINITY_DN47344_c0_g1_i1:59-2947(-)
MPNPTVRSIGQFLDGSYWQAACRSIEHGSRNMNPENITDDFYDLIGRLTSQFDQERARCDELRAENARLRTDLRLASAGSQRLLDPIPDAFKQRKNGDSRSLRQSKDKDGDLLQDVQPPKDISRLQELGRSGGVGEVSLSIEQNDGANLSPDMMQEGPQRRTSTSPGRRKLSQAECIVPAAISLEYQDDKVEGKASPPMPQHLLLPPQLSQAAFQHMSNGHRMESSASTTVTPVTPAQASPGRQGSPGRRQPPESPQSRYEELAAQGLQLPTDIGFGQGIGLGPPSSGNGSCKDPTSDNEDMDEAAAHIMRSKSVTSEMSELSLLPLWTETKGKRRLSQGERGGSMRMNSARAGESDAGVVHTSSTGSVGSSGGLLHDGLRSGDVLFEKESRMQRCMLNPNGMASMTWDVVSVIFVLYDLITIPLQVFQLSSMFFDIADVAVASVWTVDILMSFIRGVTDSGAVDMRPSKIARRYLRSWFVLDVGVVSIDWALIGLNSSADMEFLRMLRGRIVLRMLRIFRLVRIMKLVNKDNSFLKNFAIDENSKAMGSVLQLLCAIVLINHYVGCGWFAMGQIGERDKNWIDVETDIDKDDFINQYLISIHWSVTQFTPAAMDVVPVNAIERAYTVITIFCGLVIFSSFVSNMTSAMNHLNKLTSEQRSRQTALRTYIADNRVSLALLSCILSYQKSTRAQDKKRLHETDVAIFKTLPEDLLQKLHEEVYAPVLAWHPLFQYLSETEESTISSICHLAMREKSVIIGEELFRCGVRGTKMYFVVSGTLAYFLGYDEQIPQLVKSESWLCEAALWSKWEHRGRMTIATAAMVMADASGEKRSARQTGELMVLDAGEFHTIMSNTRVLREMQTYARVFTTMAAQDCGGAASVDDLWGSYSQLDTCLQRAFGLGEEAQAASKLMMLWDNGENTWRHCFSTWKLASIEDRERKRKGSKTRQGSWWLHLFGCYRR